MPAVRSGDHVVDTASLPRKRLRKRYNPAVRSIRDMDRRYAAARNAPKLVKRLESDIGGDPTAGQRELATRAALLSVLCGDAEVSIVHDQEFVVSAYLALANHTRSSLLSHGI